MIDEKIKNLLCQGYTRPQIAKELNMAKITIDKHIQKIFKIYEVKNSTELVAKLTMLRISHEFL